MEPKKQYIAEMHNKMGYFATWLPTVDLKLGDIGIMKGGIIRRGNEFERKSTLKKQGINFEIRPDKTPGNLEYLSAENATIAFKVEGSLPPEGCTLTKADAGAIIEFGDKAGVVFKANKVLNPSIEDPNALGKEILKRYNKGEWEEDWVVITEVAQSNSATIIISSGKGGKIELKATGKINAANIDIADVNANFQIAYSKNIHTKITAQEGLTPLFKAQGIKKIIIGAPTFKGLYYIGGESPTSEIPEKIEKEVPVFGNIDFIREDDSP